MMNNPLWLRRRRIGTVLGVLFAFHTASSQLAQAQVPVAAQIVTDDRYPVRRVSFPGGVTGLPDVNYSVPAGFRALTLDLYLPPGAPAAGAKPFVVYIHGGGWSGGTGRTTSAFENWPGVLASLAAKGYVVASLNYRLSGEAPFPAAEQDVKSAIRWLRTNAAAYGVDPKRGLVWGASAGGHLAALAATSCGVAKLEPPPAPPSATAAAGQAAKPEESDCVQGLVSWFGVFDFQPLVTQALTAGQNRDTAESGPGRFLGCKLSACQPETIRLASPVSFVDAHTPPTLLIHGTVDTTVAPKQSQDMDALLKSKGVPVEIMLLPGVGHSFLGATHEATRAASNAAIDKTFAFIDATIGEKPKSGKPR